MGKPREQSPSEGPRSFTRFFEQLGDGEANADVSEELFELGGLCRKEALERGECKAELTLTLKLKTDKLGQTVITYAIKRKDPVPSRPATMMWLTPAGNFTPENPRQLGLPLREVIDANGEVREVDDARPSREV